MMIKRTFSAQTAEFNNANAEEKNRLADERQSLIFAMKDGKDVAKEVAAYNAKATDYTNRLVSFGGQEGAGAATI